jgi:hypothetical protein
LVSACVQFAFDSKRQFQSVNEQSGGVGAVSFSMVSRSLHRDLGRFQHDRHAFLTFRIFYRWAALKKIAGFTREISSLLDDFAAPEYDPYRSVKFRENVFSAAEESAFIAVLDNAVDESNYFALRDNVMAPELGAGLACRAGGRS